MRHFDGPAYLFNVPTAHEKKALYFVALVTLSGSMVRLCCATSSHATAAESAGLQTQLKRVDSVRALQGTKGRGRSPTSKRKKARPASTAPIDLDHAAVTDLQSLPGIGPVLAQRIVAHRDSAGSLGQLDALCEVKGIRRGLAEKLRPLVTFTGPRRPVSVGCGASSGRHRSSGSARPREPR